MIKYERKACKLVNDNTFLRRSQRLMLLGAASEKNQLSLFKTRNKFWRYLQRLRLSHAMCTPCSVSSSAGGHSGLQKGVECLHNRVLMINNRVRTDSKLASKSVVYRDSINQIHNVNFLKTWLSARSRTAVLIPYTVYVPYYTVYAV